MFQKNHFPATIIFKIQNGRTVHNLYCSLFELLEVYIYTCKHTNTKTEHRYVGRLLLFGYYRQATTIFYVYESIMTFNSQVIIFLLMLLLLLLLSCLFVFFTYSKLKKNNTGVLIICNHFPNMAKCWRWTTTERRRGGRHEDSRPCRLHDFLVTRRTRFLDFISFLGFVMSLRHRGNCSHTPRLRHSAPVY